MEKRITVLPGDGIGPEVIAEAVKVLKAVEQRFNHRFHLEYALIGGAALDSTKSAFPEETRTICKKCAAILFGAIGDPRYDNAKVRPEQGLLEMRKELGLYANIRPITCYDALLGKIPLKAEIAKGADLLVYRELTGGIYFGEKGRDDKNLSAYDTCYYTKPEILRIAKLAFEAAMNRHKKVTVIDKANVLETSRLWRETVNDFAKFYPQVTTEFMYVDNAAMQLIFDPRRFDVILTENMFGDILTDEASVIAGSLGLLPSASVGDRYALYEPIHGSYPQATGKNIANPIGSILSAAMMLELSFGLHVESAYIHKAVREVIASGWLTPDLNSTQPVTTRQVGDKIAALVFEEMHEIV